MNIIIKMYNYYDQNQMKFGCLKSKNPQPFKTSAIKRKINHPGTIPARQHWIYLEKTLQDAGFDVWVHENRFFEGGMWVTKKPEDLNPNFTTGSLTHGSPLQHNQQQHGGVLRDKIVNSLSPRVDRIFNLGNNFRSTFFIGGEILGTFASINEQRETEFRQLVLKTKPVQSVAFPFIDFFVGGFLGDYNDDYNNDFNI